MDTTTTKTKGKAIQPVATPVAEDPSVMQEEIAALAHALWQARGCPEGSHEEDWYEAERTLVRKA